MMIAWGAVATVSAANSYAALCDSDEINRRIIASPAATYESARRECQEAHKAELAERAEKLRACLAVKSAMNPDGDVAYMTDSCLESIGPTEEQKAATARLERAYGESAAQRAVQAKAEAAWAKRPKSVSIGMTVEQVRKTQWGNPSRINSTVGRYGTREQWVYGGSQYLYFENGILTAIQQSR